MKAEIQIHIGNALKVIKTIKRTFDLVFIDADKENYLNYYKLFFDKVITGGFVLVYNALWSGKVFKKQKDPDKEVDGIIDFNKFVQADHRVENMILPSRNGIMMVRKI